MGIKLGSFAARAESRKMFDLLATMTVGACWWFVAANAGLLDQISRFALRHGLINLTLLCVFVSVGGGVALVRTTHELRSAVAARRVAEAAADRLARRDPLTGLANRRDLYEKITAMLADASARRGLVVLLIDLDRFKPVNDLHGHAAGDAVLCATAERLRAAAPPGSVVARLGGDEFAVLAPGLVSEQAMGELAGEMIDLIRRPIAWGDGFLEIDATIGIAAADVRHIDPESLLHAADVAMYQGKRQGRGVWRVYREKMDEAARARAALESDLRSAIASDHIKPFYQPIVSLPGQELVAFEALARWSHPALGEIQPLAFIAIAEECGLISELFARVLKAACLDARHWPPHIHLAVNLSPRQLLDPQLPEKVLAVLTETGFSAQRLEVELTERAVINNFEAARVTLTSLRNLGVSIALDNFGTSYSILHQLNELRFNKLKIDRSCMMNLSNGGGRATMVDAILQLGDRLSLRTTAEGIETDESLDWLANQGCSYGQGYLFGRPMSASEADAYVARSRADVAAAGV